MAAETPAAVAPADVELDIDPDDTLVLLFMCCHPALTSASAIALTLRAVGGLTTAQIAKSFLVPELTIVRRISRAKETIKASGIPFRVPDADERAERLGSVLHTLYLVFNEGYTSSGPELQRPDLSSEAIRLVRKVRKLLPANGDVAGLLALMLLIDARRAARSGQNGELIPLDEQDRSLWDRQKIDEGVALASVALSLGVVGQYQLQATIAAVHDEAVRAEDTDWRQILALYDLHLSIAPSPVVALHRAVAVGEVDGPESALAIVDGLALESHHLYHAVCADLLRRLGRNVEAAAAYDAALALSANEVERDFLGGRRRALPGA